MSDATSKKCSSCDKSFNAFRRRHHCRFCGLVFCSACCHRKLTVTGLKKPTRICTQCSETIAKAEAMRSCSACDPSDTGEQPIPGSLNVSRIQPEPNSAASLSDSDSCETSLSLAQATGLEVEDNTLDSLVQDFSSHSDFEDPCKGFLLSRTSELLAANSLDPQWTETVIRLVKQAVESVWCFTRRKGDSMNINRYVRIVKVQAADRALSQYINGVVFYKNVAHKKMKSRIVAPNILLLEGGAEFTNNDFKLVSMDTVVSQETQRQKLFVTKVLSLRPSLLFVEKGISQKTISELSTQGITAVVNIKKTVLDMISRITAGKILTSIDQAAHSRTFLGHCGEFAVKAVTRGTLVYVMQGEGRGAMGASIVLSGPDVSELRTVKKVIRTLMIDYRSAVLEADFFQLMGIVPSETAISDNHTSTIACKLLTINTKLCTKPQSLKFSLYQDPEDLPLGRKLINLRKDFSDLCVCGSKVETHDLFYCKKGGFVRVTGRCEAEEMLPMDARDSVFLTLTCKSCDEVVVLNAPLNENAWEVSFYKFISDFFMDCNRSHKSHRCEVDVFRGFRFNFILKNVELSLEFAFRPTYDLVPIHFPDNSEYYELLRFKTLIDLKEAANEVLTSLIQATYEVKQALSMKAFAEEKDESFEQVKEEIAQATDELSIELADMGKLEQNPEFRNYLLVETYRRRIFFLVCKGKSVIENSRHSLKTNRTLTLSRRRTPDVSQRQSLSGISIQQDSSWEECPVSRARDSQSMRLIHPIVATNKLDPVIRSRNFEYLQRGNLTLPLGKLNICIPVDEEDSLSIVAYALNSADFYDSVGFWMDDVAKAEDRSSVDEFIHTELLLKDADHFDTRFSTYDETDMQEAENKLEMQRLYGHHVLYHVTAYYPRQFQALQLYSEKPESFLLSISKAMRHHYTPGKSGASFSYAHDSKYVLKSVDEKEIAMFIDLAPNYFRHLFKSFYHSMPSRLAKVYGAYRVSVKNFLTGSKRVEWLLLFENLSVVMPRLHQVFDLKGTLNARRFVKPGESKTKMDRNFLDEMKGLPLFLTARAKRELDAALWNDTRFLSKQNVVDYSLLIMVSDEERKLALGVIDYMQQYTFEKAVESKYKKMTASETPTITNPEEYKNRFRTQVMQEYFLAIDD